MKTPAFLLAFLSTTPTLHGAFGAELRLHISWLTILNKRESFRKAFAGFELEKVALFDEADIKRLLLDAGIVRHRVFAPIKY